MRRFTEIAADESDDLIVIDGGADAVMRRKVRRLAKRQRNRNAHLLRRRAFRVWHADAHQRLGVVDADDLKVGHSRKLLRQTQSSQHPAPQWRRRASAGRLAVRSERETRSERPKQLRFRAAP